MRYLAVNVLFSPLKRWKKIHRYQWEAVKIKMLPLITANLTKIHRKNLSVEWFSFTALIEFNAKNRNSYIFSRIHCKSYFFSAIFSVDTSTWVRLSLQEVLVFPESLRLRFIYAHLCKRFFKSFFRLICI